MEEREATEQRDQWQLDQEKQRRNYEIAGFDAEMEAENRVRNPEFYEEEQKEMDQAITKVEPAQPMARIEPATQMTLIEAKKRFTEIKKFCKEILTEGVDYGQIPGVGKPSLWKPGAEKVLLFLMLRTDYEEIRIVEDFDKPLFYYRYRCNLFHIHTNILVGSGIGSCNSMETKYRWRTAKRTCPKCGSEVRQSKEPSKRTGKPGFYCWQKMGGCGATFHSDDPEILNQKLGKIPNEEVYDQINTIDKMAQKRAMLAPTLVVSGLSDEFTMDMEDQPTPPEPPAKTNGTPPKAAPPRSNPPRTQQKTAPPPQGGRSVEAEMRARAKVQIAEICEALVEGEFFDDVNVALMEIMDSPDTTFEHIDSYTTHPKHLKVVAGIAKGRKILKPGK